MSLLPEHAATLRPAVLPRPPLWLLGWWLAGRLVVVLTVQLSGSLTSFWGADGKWYRMVARTGYLVIGGHHSNPAFFPLYPILLRGVHLLGVSWKATGPVVANFAFLLGLGLFYRLTADLFDAALARRAATYLAIFPLGYVFSMTYPQSVVLLLLVAAPLAAARRRWWLAAAAAAAAALARPEGLFVLLPLAGIAWGQRRSLSTVEAGAALTAVLAPLAGLLSYSVYLDRTVHDPLAWMHAQETWGRRFRPGGVLRAFSQLPTTLEQNPWAARDVACFVLYLALLYAAWRLGTPRTWLAASAAVIVLPVFTGTFSSIGRYGVLAPPLVWGLASLGRTRQADYALRLGSLLLLVAGTVSIAHLSP